MGKKRLVNILRWIAVLPASIVGCLVIYYITLLLNGIFGSAYTGFNSIWQYIAPLTAQLAMGAFFVMIGCYTAPSHHKAVAICLFVILCVVDIVTAILNIMHGFVLIDLLCALATLAGGTFVFIAYLNSDEK